MCLVAARGIGWPASCVHAVNLSWAIAHTHRRTHIQAEVHSSCHSSVTLEGQDALGSPCETCFFWEEAPRSGLAAAHRCLLPQPLCQSMCWQACLPLTPPASCQNSLMLQ